MSILTLIMDRVTGRDKLRAQITREKRRYAAGFGASVVAAQAGKLGGGWTGTPADEDAQNKEYLFALQDVIQRSQDLDINNPDVHGFHRTRVAQIVGPGVQFKHCPRPSEIGLDSDACVELSGEVNRVRQLHSRLGGFDSTGNNRSEGKQQERALLTAFVCGACLIHRVYRSDDRTMLPFSLELIPGSRISTPYERLGDPLLSYGIEYDDDHRTRVVAYHVRRVSMTRGNSMIPDYVWDRLPVEDCSLLSLTEMAGLDRAMPLSLSVVRMLRNRGEFIESAVESARAQANIYAVTESAPGGDPWGAAADDQTNSVVPDSSNGLPIGFTQLGGGVRMMYTQNGEKVNWNSSKLPDPDLTGFMKVTDSRLSRGFVASLSRFTREVNSSWAGGRLEDQQDDPIVDQYRDSFISAWQKVNEWFLESVWLASALKLPGYSDRTRAFWAEFRAEFPGKVHINPQDTMKAREMGYQLRTLTPQQACEEDGKDLRDNLRQWGEAMKLVADAEKEFSLPEGSLGFLLSGKTVSTTAGDEIGAAEAVPESASGESPDKQAHAAINRIRKYLRAFPAEVAK